MNIREIISLIESVQTTGPAWFNHGEIVDIKDIEHLNDDVDGMLEGKEWDFEWRLCDEIPIDVIEYLNPEFHDEERMVRLRPQDKHMPIIVIIREDGRVELVDGGHRIKVARERGQTTIVGLAGLDDGVRQPLDEVKKGRRILFHATTIRTLPDIMAVNTLEARTTDVARGVKGPGVCLTRSYEYAQKHKGPRQGVVLVIDATGLDTTAVSYWPPEEQKRYGRDDEQEEFVSGPILNLRSRLISINSEQNTFDVYAEIIEDEISPESEESWQYDKQGLANLRRYAANGIEVDAKYWNKWHP